MNALAYDLGSKCGWAALHDGARFSGLLKTTPTRFESNAMRFIKFKKYVREHILSFKPEMVFYERVERHVGTVAAHVYAGYYTALTTMLSEEFPSIPYHGLSVQEIKKHGTGRGNADKNMMMLAAGRRWPEQELTTSDVADALWALDCGITKFKT